MAAHLRFLAKHRKVLKLKVNAAEDLLLNGVRAPEHRGVCNHLLAKIDAQCVRAAVDRLSDPQERLRMLDGVVRFCRDTAVMLLYLETLAETTSAARAADGVLAGLKQLDFASVSTSQLRRLLDLVLRVLPDDERAPLVLGLMDNASCRLHIERDATGWPCEVADFVQPLSALHAALRGPVAAGTVRGVRTQQTGSMGDTGSQRDNVAAGVRLLLCSSKRSWKSLPVQERGRLLELALSHLPDPLRDADAIDALLRSLPEEGRLRSTLGLTWARLLLEAQADSRARALLQWLSAAFPDFELPRQWLQALDWPRLGRLCLQPHADGADAPQRDRGSNGEGDRPASRRRRRRRSTARDTAAGQSAAPGPHSAAMARAFFLDTQQDAQLILAPEPGHPNAPPNAAAPRPNADRMGAADPTGATIRRAEEAAQTHRALAGVGVAPLLAHGVDDLGRGYLAVVRVGVVLRPGALRSSTTRGNRREIGRMAYDGVRILSALCGCGYSLPDAAPHRFMVDGGGRLWLGNTWGCVSAPDAAAGKTLMLGLAKDLCTTLLSHRGKPIPGFERPLAAALACPDLESLAGIAGLGRVL